MFIINGNYSIYYHNSSDKYAQYLIQIMKEHHREHQRTKTKTKVKRLQNSPYAIAEGEPIGRGSFASIKRAYNLENVHEELAVKIISIQDEQTAKTIKPELAMLRELPHHPNLVNCMKIQISSQHNFYIIMEYCNQGNLEKYIFDNKNDLCEQKIWFFLKQFCEGYRVLYEKAIIHRDIKPENILIRNGNFKISDFGLAKVIKDVDVIQNISSKGTPLYMAPQLHFQSEGSSKVDVFSLGVIVYRLAFRGKHPFFDNGRNYHSIFQYFKELQIRKLTFPQHHNRSQQLVRLIESMLNKDKEKRIGWKQIFQIDRIRRAVRNQRKKHISTMQQFKKSLLVIGNTSITDVKILQDSKTEGDDSSDANNLNSKGDGYLVIQEAFNKKQRSNLQKRLYQNKLIYTFIDIMNRRIHNTIEKQAKMHPYIGLQLEKIIQIGMKYSIKVISQLEQISGDWNNVSKGQILNFQDIFEADRDIIVEKLKSKGINIEDEQYINGSYEDALYHILIQFQDYPKQLKRQLKVIFAFLADMYDMALKFGEKDLDEEDKQRFDKIQQDHIQKFQDYIFSLQQTKQLEITQKLKKMGLYIQ